MDISSHSLQHASMSSPKVATQENSQWPSRTPPVELWVIIILCYFFVLLIKHFILLSCDYSFFGFEANISQTTFLLQPLWTKCAAVSAHGFMQFVCHVDHIIIWVLNKPLLNPSRSFFCWRALLRLRKMKTSTKPLNETVMNMNMKESKRAKASSSLPSYSFTSGYEMSHSSGQRPETSSSQVNKITLYLAWLTELLDSLVVRREVKRGGTERRLMWKTGGEWWEEYKEGVTWPFHLWKRQFIEADHLWSATRGILKLTEHQRNWLHFYQTDTLECSFKVLIEYDALTEQMFFVLFSKIMHNSTVCLVSQDLPPARLLMWMYALKTEFFSILQNGPYDSVLCFEVWRLTVCYQTEDIGTAHLKKKMVNPSGASTKFS